MQKLRLPVALSSSSFLLLHFLTCWSFQYTSPLSNSNSLYQGYFQLRNHPLNNICRENLQTYIWILLLPTDIRYMYIWNSRMYSVAFRHTIDIVNWKTMKSACVNVTAQNRNFFFVLSSAVKKYWVCCVSLFVCKVGHKTVVVDWGCFKYNDMCFLTSQSCYFQ